MKFLIILAAFLISTFCSSNYERERSVYISEFGWTFLLPLETKFEDSAFDRSGKITRPFRQMGTAESVEVFVIKDDSLNWFKSLAIKDTMNFRNWENYHYSDNRWYFDQISLNPRINIIDTNYSKEIISGVSFNKEYIKYYSKKKNTTVSEYHYFGKFKRYELAINFHFTDSTIGRKYFNILQSSKFE